MLRRGDGLRRAPSCGEASGTAESACHRTWSAGDGRATAFSGPAPACGEPAGATAYDGPRVTAVRRRAPARRQLADSARRHAESPPTGRARVAAVRWRAPALRRRSLARRRLAEIAGDDSDEMVTVFSAATEQDRRAAKGK